MTPFDPAQTAREAYARLFGQQTRPINGHKILRDLAERAYAAGLQDHQCHDEGRHTGCGCYASGVAAERARWEVLAHAVEAYIDGPGDAQTVYDTLRTLREPPR